jgi:repressor LexA
VQAMDNKKIFADNLNYYMELNQKSRRDLSDDLDISYYTVTDWAKGKKYPRMDSVERLAYYFNVLKSDLIEERTPERLKVEKKADAITDAVLKMKTDAEFLSLVENLCELDADQIKSVKHLLSAFLK